MTHTGGHEPHGPGAAAGYAAPPSEGASVQKPPASTALVKRLFVGRLRTKPAKRVYHAVAATRLLLLALGPSGML